MRVDDRRCPQCGSPRIPHPLGFDTPMFDCSGPGGVVCENRAVRVELAEARAEVAVLKRALELLHAASLPPADGKAGCMLAYPPYWVDKARAELKQAEGPKEGR